MHAIHRKKNKRRIIVSKRIGEKKMKALYTLILLITMLVGGYTSVYAVEIKITASVDKTRLELGDFIRYTIGIHGKINTEEPQLTSIEDFSLKYGPSISTQTKIVNNAVSVYRGYTYGLAPQKRGKLTIGPAILKYKGKTYKSNSINIEVVDRTPFGNKGGGRKKGKDIDTSKRIFIELTTNKKDAYLYEQVIMSFKLYFQRGLPIEDLDYVPPRTKNFFAEKLGDERRFEEVRDGILYNVIELRTALFPVASGNIEIPPAKFKCNIRIRQKRHRNWDPFNDSFDNSLFDEFLGRNEYRYPVERTTDSIRVKIKPLPDEGKPKDFAGAVGTFTMDVLAKPTVVKVGEPVTLSIKVLGKGNIQTIGEPTLDLEGTDDFEVYPAETNTTITDKKEGIKGEKLFSRVIEPQHDGIEAIPAISFSFFDPALEKYRTITHAPIPIKVEKYDEEIPIRLALKSLGKAKGQVKILTKDILPIMSNLYSFENQGPALHKRPLFMAFIFITPILFAVACLYIQKHREKLQTDVSYARKRRAPSQLRKRLLDTKQLLQSENPSEFYSALDKTITEYIANKINVASASITHDNVSDILENRKVMHETIAELKQCLELCDYGRFSTDRLSKEQMENTLNAAEKIIKQLEREL